MSGHNDQLHGANE